MMRTISLSIIIVILTAALVVLIFRVVDAALELDDLKSQIKLQRDSLVFLEAVTNTSIKKCSMSVIEFERIARTNGNQIVWQDGFGLVGPFKVSKINSCIDNINLVGF